MPYVFIDDGSPEANDYSTNYEWVEPKRDVWCARMSTPAPSAARASRWASIVFAIQAARNLMWCSARVP